MNIFNPNNLRNKQRFPVAVAAGVITAILCAIVIGLITSGTGWYYSLLYIAAGYAIGYAIKYFGRGVDKKFSILSVACFILCVFLGDFVAFTHQLSVFSLNYLPYSIESTFRSLFQLDVMGMIHLIMIVYAGYISYYMAKIV
ncbi:hypothetical protein M2475_000506 [Breznakia sp. PF5-3]|uniref:hypothetical protein n=1 Tax=unclassified Breznakia TaxID=2623764 RepID=UPI0024072342|nr:MULTISPECIES: hypothetical protein [unclassified Breznakia]MDF9824156.1 hypothetical protein [Breznakia sp. PM6-1]MDF9834954.1 hypothetical protein [Breznakia sp. PF5-3]MDF9837177.1 hypothetical protein [Breznakia sp. PFB2-8]MDF9859167.1 hypothetical protein [Breznakia sp. PH5-24]